MKKYVFIILFSFLVLIFFFNRGFAYYDEGFILHAAQRILQGEIPYKDFDFIYTPGTIFIVAAAFKIFGESIIIGRVLIMVIGVLTALLIYFVTNIISNNKLISLLSVLVYLAWGPTHINFPWPSTFAFSLGLIAAYFLFKKEFFYSGLLTAITLLFKQNFGVAVFLSSILGMWFNKPISKMRDFLNFLIGIATGLALFLVYLLSTNSLVGFLDNFYFYTVKKIILEGVAGSGFPSGVKGLFYLFPGLISLIAVFVAYKRRRKYIVLPLFTFFFYLFGIRPTTDYVHLTILTASVGIPLVIIQSNSFHFKRLFFSGLSIVVIVLGVYTGIWRNYYRWDSSLIKQKYFISHPQARILVDRKFASAIPQILSGIDQETANDDYIFVFPNAPMFYFLSQKKNPTRFINLPLGLHTSQQEQKVVDDLRKKRVKIILTNELSQSWSYPLVSDYILKNYLKIKEIFEFTLWEKVESEKHSEVQNI